MKSVLFSDIVGAPRRAGLRRLAPLAAYGLTLLLGTPLLVLALRLLDPGAPLAYIVLPVLAGLALPLCTPAAGRLDISTRFDARHLRPTLDSALADLGYAQVCAGPDRIRYATAGRAWRARTLSVRVQPHVLEVVGPIPTLRALQAALAGPAAASASAVPAAPRTDLSIRETVAAAIQISDNAERVAGMAE